MILFVMINVSENPQALSPRYVGGFDYGNAHKHHMTSMVTPTKFKPVYLIGRRRFFDAFTYFEINSAHGHVKSLDGRDKSHSKKRISQETFERINHIHEDSTPPNLRGKHSQT